MSNPVTHAQDERHLRLLNALPAIAWSASARTFRFNYINPAAETLLGYPASAWIEQPDFWSRHLHPDDRHVVRLCHTETVACRSHELVYRMIAADGRTVWIRDYVNVHSVDGEPEELFGVMVDITDSVRAQQALQLSERRYRELVEGVSDILFTVDGEGRFVSLSRSFERSTGYRVEDWIGRPFAELFRVPSTPHADQLRELMDGDAGTIREYELPARSGAVVTLEVLSQPRYVDGVVAGTIGMARDVTESRNNARKLEEAKRMSSLGQLAASLAHEFNNVLMGIQPFVEVVARNASGPRVSDALSHITRAISRGKRASQEVLRFAKPKEPQLSVIDARAWLPTFLRQLTAALPGSVTLGSSIGADVRFIRGDGEHLEQVITNLVYNARDAMPAGGAIHVRVSRAQDDLVRISVHDEGPGIAPEMLDRIFEPLFTTKRNGTGLGLAIARRLIERQGGALTAENRPEGGSVFHVFVPLLETATPAIQPVARATPSVTRILLVEDDPSAGAGLELLLQSEGYETTWVRLASDACAAAHRTNPQVAIIDVNLPDGNGVDLVPLLRAEHARLPIVLSTGHVELNISDENERILSLMKPYELGELLAAIANVTKAA
jgi:PAS domain S-box-containing protein